MIIEKTFKNVKCDGCGEILEEEWYATEEEVTLSAQNNDWREVNGKHYCPTCYAEQHKAE